MQMRGLALMTIDRRLLGTKSINFILGMGSNFALLAAAARISTGFHQSKLLFCSGLLAYAVLADLGLGRPIYSRLRELYLLKQKDELGSMLGFSLCYVAGVSCLLWVVLCGILLIHAAQWGEHDYLLSLVLSAGITAMCGIAFFRDIHEAFDNYLWFEKIDGARRFSIMACAALAGWTHDIWKYAIPVAVFSAFLLLLCFMRFFRYWDLATHRTGVFNLACIRREYGILHSSISSNFLFRIGEVVLYNWGLLVYGGSEHLHSLIVFATWQRLFIGLCMPARIIQDSSVPAFTAAWFSGKSLGTAAGGMKRVLVACSILTFAGFLGFASVAKFAIRWLANGQHFMMGTFLIGCALWSVANAAQHMAGTYLLAISKHLKQLCNGTLGFLALGVVTTIAVCKLPLGIHLADTEKLLVIQGVIYVFYASTQLGLLQSVLKTREEQAA
jgi:hypothetical protein